MHKKMLTGMLSAYFLVLVAIYIIQFVLNQYGLEYRACVVSFKVFWTYKLSFIAVALFIFFIFLEKRKDKNERRWFRTTWTLISITYIIASLFLMLILAIGGFLDVPKEEMLETGYLKITEIKGFIAVEYYYCEPTSKYVRRPLTSPSHIINPEYE